MPPDPENRDAPAGDFLTFLRQHKAWWLVPLLVVALLFAFLIFLSGTATTPFIYTTH